MSDVLSPAKSAVTKQKRLNRSCVLCHQRKTRCDKQTPCGSCKRADVLCYYPQAEQTIRRPQKTTIADVSARLARLERTINALSKDSPIKQDSASPEPSEIDLTSLELGHDVVGTTTSEEKLIQGNGASRYFNEALLSCVMEEEQEILSLIGLQPEERKSSSIEVEPLLSSFHGLRTADESYHPSRRSAIQLWQAYIANVDPLIKILHLPTIEPVVYAAINSSTAIDSDTNSLLLAIYFAATASLSNHNAFHLLREEKHTALNNFKRGLEQSLAVSNFLDAPTFVALQAITIYIRCLRVYNGGRALWTFNGLIMRSAQSIGLHRDGKNFKLSPFECEMRRRLWWYIVTNDSRVAEDHGFTIFNLDAATDIALPLNVNDNQLDPNMTELPAVEPKWSDMTFTLIIIEANNALLNLHHRAIRSRDAISEDVRTETFSTLKAHFEQDYLQHCDQNIPVQQATWLIGQVLSRKLEFKSRLPWSKSSFFASSPASAPPSSCLMAQAKEENLLEACGILELNELFYSDDLLEGFQWSFQTYPQYDVIMYILWHLCIQPEGPNINRAWKLIDVAFATETAHREGWKWKVLRRLRERARKVRASSRGTGTEGHGDATMEGQTFGGGPEDGLATEAGLDADLPPNMNWMPDQLGDLDWSALADKVDLQDYELKEFME